jgi:5-bromo-4-chloroindolyl phosphate hydrolysis protein
MKLIPEDEFTALIKQNEELKKYGEKLTQSNVKLQKQLEDTQNKLEHLEEIVKFAKSPVAVGSNEEELCKLEIRRLYESAKQGPLQFNEVKAFEIYVKSLMLIQGKTSTDDKKSKKSEQPSLNHDQLLQLALQVVDDTSEQ